MLWLPGLRGGHTDAGLKKGSVFWENSSPTLKLHLLGGPWTSPCSVWSVASVPCHEGSYGQGVPRRGCWNACFSAVKSKGLGVWWQGGPKFSLISLALPALAWALA